MPTRAFQCQKLSHFFRTPLAVVFHAGAPREVGAGFGGGVLSHLCGRPLRDHFAAVLAGARPDIHDVVGGADHIDVVFNRNHGVAGFREPLHHGNQFFVVSLMQPDRGFIQHIRNACEARTDLTCKTDTLHFAP